MGMRKVKKVWDDSAFNENGEIDLSVIENTVVYNYVEIINELLAIDKTGKNDEDTLDDAKSIVLTAINKSDCSDSYRIIRTFSIFINIKFCNFSNILLNQINTYHTFFSFLVTSA